MQLKSLLSATVAVWVLLLAWDNFVSPTLFGATMATIPGAVADFPKHWEVIGDLLQAGVLVWFYDGVRAVFGTGLAGGVRYGLRAGILINFPTWLWTTVYFSWPYRGVWMMVIALIVVYTVAGALTGLVYEKTAGKTA